jgi:hypothetical protein
MYHPRLMHELITVRRFSLAAFICALAVVAYQAGALRVRLHLAAPLNTFDNTFDLTAFQRDQLAEQVGQESGRIEDIGGGWARYTNPRDHFSLEFPDRIFPSGATQPIPLVVFEDTFAPGRTVAGSRLDTAYDIIPRERILGTVLAPSVSQFGVLRDRGATSASSSAVTLQVSGVPDESKLMDTLREVFANCPFTALEQLEGPPGTFDLLLRTDWSQPDDLYRIAATCRYNFVGSTTIKYSPRWKALVYVSEEAGPHLWLSADDTQGGEKRMFASFRFE